MPCPKSIRSMSSRYLKSKTNYRIHLIFSERTLLAEPEIKIATRSVFFGETGKRARTKRFTKAICFR